jgi:hypothetical protein
MTVQQQTPGGRRSRRAVLAGLAGFGVTSAGLALLEGCARPFWDRRPALARVGLLTANTHDSALVGRYYEVFKTGIRESDGLKARTLHSSRATWTMGPCPSQAVDAPSRVSE